MDLVQKYIGSDGARPKLSKLGGSDWGKMKSKVKAAVAILAEDLVEVYAKRQAAEGFKYSPDTPWQRNLRKTRLYGNGRPVECGQGYVKKRYGIRQSNGQTCLRRRRLRKNGSSHKGGVQDHTGRETGGISCPDDDFGTTALFDVLKRIGLSRTNRTA